MTVRQTSTADLALGKAAQELALERGELELALQLGQVRAVRDDGTGPHRVERREIDRLRAGPGFPAALRERLRTVGTVDGAALASISQGRFLRLARTGHFAPVRFYVNRYHAVVWLYLAAEVLDFTRNHAALLTGRTPPGVRALLAAGEDRRPRNWRGRRLGQLLRASSDPWRRAAAIAAVLDPVTVAEAVPDPYERSRLSVLRPDLVPASPKSPRVREIVKRLATADQPDEILWHRASLADALREARKHSAAPRRAPQAPHAASTPHPTQASHLPCTPHAALGSSPHAARRRVAPRRAVPHPAAAATSPPTPAVRRPRSSRPWSGPTRPRPGRVSWGTARGLLGRLWPGRAGRA